MSKICHNFTSTHLHQWSIRCTLFPIFCYKFGNNKTQQNINHMVGLLMISAFAGPILKIYKILIMYKENIAKYGFSDFTFTENIMFFPITCFLSSLIIKSRIHKNEILLKLLSCIVLVYFLSNLKNLIFLFICWLENQLLVGTASN